MEGIRVSYPNTTVRLNYKNETNGAVYVLPSVGNSTDTINIYFNGVEQIK